MDCQNLKEGYCVLVWYPSVETTPSPRSGSDQKVVPAARGEHGHTRLLPSCHRRKFCAPPPSPRGAKFTRMTQHQLIILQPCLLLSLLLVWRQWESLPQNLGHFLMTCQGRMSQRCMKRHGGGNALSLELGLGVCSHSSERVSLCHPVSLNTL